MSRGYADILDFWFGEPMRRHWFRSTPELDDHIRERYEPLWQRAIGGGLAAWQHSAEGCLAPDVGQGRAVRRIVVVPSETAVPHLHK